MTDIADFRAFRIHHKDGQHQAGLTRLTPAALTPGDILLKVMYSSINYKDALAGLGKARILRRYPLNGGIDAAGYVVASRSSEFKSGDAVICTGSGLSETRDGGFAEYTQLPAKHAVALPQGLSLKEAMIIGTAGFTAALGLERMLTNGQQPDMGPVAITGASGGVGMLAVDIFNRAGFDVAAISGKVDKHPFLQKIGAATCHARDTLDAGDKPMVSGRFGGAMDTTGGPMLAALLPTIKPLGNVATCGNAAGIALQTTVMPFIIRGVSLLGTASANTPPTLRRTLWQRLASDWKPRHLDMIHTATVGLDTSALHTAFTHMLAGASCGRTLVNIAADNA